MKKLGKLNIDPKRIMKNKELVTLRGGYGWVSCRIGSFHCNDDYVNDCQQSARNKCDEICPSWDNLICAGV
jgi:hypothetical protein